MYVLDTCLWVIGSILCAAALLTGLARKRFDQLPAFSFYLGISALTNPVGIVIRSPWLYEWFVFSVSIAGFVLELSVIYELANRLFLSRSPFDKIRTAPRWSTAALFLGVTVLGEALHWYEPVGAAVILAGVALATTTSRARRPKSVGGGPGQQVVGAPGVDDPVG